MTPRLDHHGFDQSTNSLGGDGGQWDIEPPEPPAEDPPSSRLNLLLSYGGWREESAVNQLPRLLAPLGIHSIRVHSGDEATDVIRTMRVHIAVVDLGIPLRRDESARPAGSRILTLLRRLDQPPPTVVLRPPHPAGRESVRTLSDALREGAFAVLDRPVELETMLEVMRRVLRRYYADHWPQS